MPRDRTTLFCAGFSQRTRAKDLAYEFERFGRLVRCDIPAPKSSSAKAFAFVEFEDYRDADDAYYEMQGARFEGHSLSLQRLPDPGDTTTVMTGTGVTGADLDLDLQFPLLREEDAFRGLLLERETAVWFKE
ncbi:hypothetical protein HDU77_007986 [Chytriomyces hyalinus]|nr:hypothetical protein HDU77_007986 [Chytriomyces hyalinus]